MTTTNLVTVRLSSKMKKDGEHPAPGRQIQKIPIKESKPRAKTSTTFYTSIVNYNMLDILNGRKPKGCTQRKEIIFLSKQTEKIMSSPHTEVQS